MEPKSVAGLTGVLRTELARIPVRTRDSAVTRSAWRITVVSDQGDGTIAFVEGAGQNAAYRGDGVFLGLGQEALGEAWRALSQPATDEPEISLPQLG